ncbi:MAG: DUF2164 family protein [Clostridiales bacterium]|nr:DUF2164 family protein [Clostridiales bacterium]
MKRESFREIRLSDEDRQRMYEEIAAFYLDEYEEKIGIIKQSQIFDLFMERMAPVIYNKALDDARMWYGRQQENLEADFYEMYKDVRY